MRGAVQIRRLGQAFERARTAVVGQGRQQDIRERFKKRLTKSGFLLDNISELD
jgi:hypothetical protein